MRGNTVVQIEKKSNGRGRRIEWLREGDKNIKYFHLTIIQRRQRNQITRIKNDKGEWVIEEGAAIKNELQQWY